MDQIAIKADNICKSFSIGTVSILGGVKNKKEKRQVINNVSFQIFKGESIGIIGLNGSGKSTILKMLSGIMYPDSGVLKIFGKVASILELGMGFHQDFTGRENVYLKCSLFGFSKKETDSFIDKIIDFSELREQIDDPVRTYSSGMYARLAFSIAINVKSDIVIIDEVLSVGDEGFNIKCKFALDQLKNNGITIIVASHALSLIKTFCDRAIWVEMGSVKAIGPSFDICTAYEQNLRDSYKTIFFMAESGDVQSQIKMGEMYYEGKNGVTIDYDKAEYWFNKAKASGSKESYSYLGKIKENRGDMQGAMHYYSIAAEFGDLEAASRIVVLSDDTSSTIANVFDELEKHSHLDNIQSIIMYATALFKGTGIRQNRREAIRLMEYAIDLGDTSQIPHLAICYRDGLGVDKNCEKATYWFEKGSKIGQIWCMITYAHSLLYGITLEQNVKKAIEWYTVAANCGDIGAMKQLGIIYRDGLGVPKDTKLSKKWFLQQAYYNAAVTEYELASTLLMDNSLAVKEKAIPLLISSASKGYVKADLQLGFLYNTGYVVDLDYNAARDYFIKACEQYNPTAMYEIGCMYKQGHGFKKDDVKSFEYYLASADGGNTNARYEVGACYYYGFGTDKDLNNALKYLTMASNYGEKRANELINQVRLQLSANNN